MKKILSGVLFVFLLFISAVPVYAAEDTTPIASDETILPDGTVVTSELFDITAARSSDKTYTHRCTFTRNDTTIGIVAITATFRYDGSTVSVVSKSVSQSDTYNGWNYKQNSFSSFGGTVTLDAKLTKLLVLSVPFTMTLSCDENGNISYT